MRLQMAGPKLRAQAIARTIEHIERVDSGKSGLVRALNATTYEYTAKDYVREERARLEKLRGMV